MTDLPDFRKGDLLRITVEGTYESYASRGPAGSRYRTLRLATDGVNPDISVSWEEETAAPEITVLATTYEPGDVADIRPESLSEYRRAFYVKPTMHEGYWVDRRGTTWSRVPHENIRLVARASGLPSKES